MTSLNLSFVLVLSCETKTAISMYNNEPVLPVVIDGSYSKWIQTSEWWGTIGSKVWPKSYQILLAELKECSKTRDLETGKQLHEEAIALGHDLNIYVLSTLINMYAKCGSMVLARQLFNQMQKPDVVTWTALLLGYVNNGNGLAALDLFSEMKVHGCMPDSIAYLAAVKACASLAANEDSPGKLRHLERGREIHLQVGCRINIYVENALIDMYSKCGSMAEARSVFDGIRKPDVVSWNALLLGYAENGEGLATLDLFSKMKASGLKPDPVTYLAALKACASSSGFHHKHESLEKGRRIHAEIGSISDQNVKNTLIDMYSKCGSMVDARLVFDSIQIPDVVSWNSLILGYAENGEGLAALQLFSTMKTREYVPDSLTYLAVVKACTSLAVNTDDVQKRNCLDLGREIHVNIGYHLTHNLKSTLIDMYAKCGSMVDARRVFDSIEKPDVVSWTALLLGYAENEDGTSALEMFSRMKASGCTPDSVAYVAALKGCTSLPLKEEGLEYGRNIHSELGCHLNNYVQSTLIDMYANCGSMEDARNVFDSIQNPDVVSWNVLLLGYADNGDGLTSLNMFSKMKALGCRPNSLTYVAALKACSLAGALALGRKFHLEISDFTRYIVTCLVDFYAKCGSMVEAREVFDLHSAVRDVSTWTALLGGYCSFDINSAFEMFELMEDEGMQPDSITFVCMLLCCSHAGFIEKAWELFEVMPVKYKVKPGIIHYNCMVDALGRANRLNDAILMVQKMPCNASVVTWKTLLGACRKWKNVEMGRLAFQCLIDIDNESASANMLMSHIIYGSKGMLDEQQGY